MSVTLIEANACSKKETTREGVRANIGRPSVDEN